MCLTLWKVGSQERDNTSVPCFLEDVRGPLVRAGQQLEIIVRLLNVCKFAAIEEYQSYNLADLDGILPFWDATPSNSLSLLSKLTFNRKGIRALLQLREIMYEAVLAKLNILFTNLDVRHQMMGRTVKFLIFFLLLLIIDNFINIFPYSLL